MLVPVLFKPRLLIVGCGDIGLRVAALARGRWRLRALTASPQRLDVLRAAGIRPLLGDLDDRRSLRRLRGLARWVVMLAPPPAQGETDPRSRRLATLLRSSMIGAGAADSLRLVYASTSGVYGDRGGAVVRESDPPTAQSPRARRRLDAEGHWRAFGRAGARVAILRVPGIYDAEARSPRRRLVQGLPVPPGAEDPYTSHIHADDLARCILFALMRGAPNRVYHASDDTRMRLGEYLDLAARVYGLPPPPRLPLALAPGAGVSPLALSFLRESRQLDNHRLRAELGVALRHADVVHGLRG